MRVQADELALNYEIYGEAGEWLVMCHGLGAGLQSMREPAHYFADGYRVLIWDNRGLGGSDDAAEGGDYSIATHARDLEGLLRALGIERPIVYGVSWGGVVALRHAIDFPGRSRALVVDSTSAEMNAHAAENWIARGRALFEGGVEAMAAAPAGLTEGGGAAPRPPRSEAEPLRIDARGFLETCEALATLHTKPMTEDLRALDVPTLAIVGEDDHVAGVGGTVKLSRAIPGCRLVIVPNAGHGVCMFDPERLRLELESLIAGLDG
ncbi:MAG: alpha/beta fold hydrolase [Dehalococcoidia bacterium]